MNTMEKQIEAVSMAVMKAMNKLGLSVIKNFPFFGMNEKRKQVNEKKAA